MTVQNIKSPAKKTKKRKEKIETDTGKIYMLSNHTRVRCTMWSKDRESFFGEVLDSPITISVMVPASHVMMELKQNGNSNKNN
jgi:hypothetical protein